jgi:hypothetical protein
LRTASRPSRTLMSPVPHSSTRVDGDVDLGGASGHRFVHVGRGLGA